jgi:uncharacterized YigZ family protein
MAIQKTSFQTLKGFSTALFKDKGSKFYAYAYGLQSEEDIQLFLLDLKKEHFKARHHCFAWKLGLGEDHYRTNDDGEPSGTAGRPIFGQILSHDLTDVLIVVVRYFGGTLLGTSGLIHAYRESARLAIEAGEIIQVIVTDTIHISYDYSMTSGLMNVIKSFQAKIISESYELHPSIKIQLPIEQVTPFIIKLKATIAEISIEEAELLESIPNLKIDIC